MKLRIPFLIGCIILLVITGCSPGRGGGGANAPVTTTSGPNTVLANGVAVGISSYNGKQIYTVNAPMPASKPQSDDAPTIKYVYYINSTAGGTTNNIVNSSDAMTSPIHTKSAHLSKQSIAYAQQISWDQTLRKKENVLLSSRERQVSKQTKLNLSVPASITVGTPWNNVTIACDKTTINTTCEFVSSHAYFFVDNRNISAMNSYLSSYATAFEQIYQTNHSKFGTENDVDGNVKVIIIFSQELTGGLLGYFYPGDKYSKADCSDSNEGDIFYLTTTISIQGTQIQGPIIDGTLAHEFQHMIYFDQHYNRGVSSTYAWLNEALSQAAEYYNNYTDNHLGWINSFLNDGWEGLSLTHWTQDNYGYGALFIRYLIDRFGDTAIKNMCSTDKVGIDAVQAATGTDFNTLFSDFTQALVMSGTGDSTNPRYKFTTLNLQTVQSSGRGGLITPYYDNAGGTDSYSLYPYELRFDQWTGSYGSIKLSGSSQVGTVFGLSR